MNILLDYVFPVSSVTPTPAASTGFLKKACVVVKPITEGVGVGVITACTSQSQIAALTNNLEAQQMLNAGMASVFILPSDDLDLAAALEGHESDFYTILISSDFDDEEVQGEGGDEAVAEVKAFRKIQDILYTAKTDGILGNLITIDYNDTEVSGAATIGVIGNAISVGIESGVTTAATIKTAIEAYPAAHALVTVAVDSGDETDPQVFFASALALTGGVDEVEGVGLLDVGEFSGVIGIHSNDEEVAGDYAVIENRCGFYGSVTHKAKNMMYAFGSMLSNALTWNNQQYISMPVSDGVATLGEAEAFFDDKVSFVISDDTYSNRLALLACGGKAIVAPYIKRNLEIDLQSAALSFISGNQPTYSKKYATLLENELNDVVALYIERGWIDAGTIEILLEQDNFVASGYINIAEPKALWRVFAEMRQTLS